MTTRYALRVCMRHAKTTACVHIYSAMGLHEEAVELALEVDVDLAKQNADAAGSCAGADDAVCKRLWLLIARHTIDSHADIKASIAILRECPVGTRRHVTRVSADLE